MSCQTALPMGQRVADGFAAVLAGRDPEPLRMRYVWQNISLGRLDGLTQFVRPDDSPVEFILTGRTSARFKEVITRSTVQVMRRPGPYVPGRSLPPAERSVARARA